MLGIQKPFLPEYIKDDIQLFQEKCREGNKEYSCNTIVDIKNGRGITNIRMKL